MGAPIASAPPEGVANLLDASGVNPIRKLSKTAEICEYMVFSPDGRVLFTGGANNTFALWDTDSGAEIRRVAIGPRNGYVECCGAFASDGRWLLTPDKKGNVQIWDFPALVGRG